MNTKKFSEAMGELDTKYIEKAMNYQAKKKKKGWLKWGFMAACLCLALAAAFVIPSLTSAIPGSELQSGSVADYPAMIMVNNRIYEDSGEVFDTPAFAGQDGQITSSCDSVPAENNQSNFGSGYPYRYGENDTIYVLLEDGWHVFKPFKHGGSENVNMENLSEQEKMELDPNYNAD